mgnify:CR=1 FL=1
MYIIHAGVICRFIRFVVIPIYVWMICVIGIKVRWCGVVLCASTVSCGNPVNRSKIIYLDRDYKGNKNTGKRRFFNRLLYNFQIRCGWSRWGILLSIGFQSVRIQASICILRLHSPRLYPGCLFPWCIVN